MSISGSINDHDENLFLDYLKHENHKAKWTNYLAFSKILNDYRIRY